MVCFRMCAVLALVGAALRCPLLDDRGVSWGGMHAVVGVCGRYLVFTSCRLVAGSRWRDTLAGWGCPAAPCSCRGGRRGARWKLHVAFTPSDVSLLLTPERPGSSRCRCPRCLCGQIPGHTCPSSKLSARGRNLLPKPSPPGESRARRRPKVWLHLAPRTAAALPWRPAGPPGGSFEFEFSCAAV